MFECDSGKKKYHFVGRDLVRSCEVGEPWWLMGVYINTGAFSELRALLIWGCFTGDLAVLQETLVIRIDGVCQEIQLTVNFSKLLSFNSWQRKLSDWKLCWFRGYIFSQLSFIIRWTIKILRNQDPFYSELCCGGILWLLSLYFVLIWWGLINTSLYNRHQYVAKIPGRKLAPTFSLNFLGNFFY